MAIPIYDRLVHYTTPPNNYIGAAIFLSYIVLALYATASIIYSLYTQYIAIYHAQSTSGKPNAQVKTARDACARHIKIYSYLASISFATLSYHMLFFLVTHYFEWSGHKSRSLSDVSIERLKKWMLESTLFQDFAKDLMKSAPNAVWTQAAILGTWFWNIWMAQKARSHALKPIQMYNMILLSQILPISFTVSLFIIQLHLSSPDIQDPASKRITSSRLGEGRQLRASLQLPNIILNAALLALPSLRHSQAFSSLVLVERFMLLLPHSGIMKLRDRDVVKCITVSGAFVATSWYMMRQELAFAVVLKPLFNGGYAVKALGWDAVLGAVVYMVVGWGGGV